VGGIKEKVLAARRMGINEVILPAQNEKNIKEDLTPVQRRDLTVHYVTTMDEVLNLALAAPVRKPEIAPKTDEQLPRPRFSLA
jgi:ATP-dependent Lon protease